jgi:hypothetical protein
MTGVSLILRIGNAIYDNELRMGHEWYKHKKGRYPQKYLPTMSIINPKQDYILKAYR